MGGSKILVSQTVCFSFRAMQEDRIVRRLLRKTNARSCRPTGRRGKAELNGRRSRSDSRRLAEF